MPKAVPLAPWFAVVALASVANLAGCGGKIEGYGASSSGETGAAGAVPSSGSPFASPSASTEETAPAPPPFPAQSTKPSVADACGTICKRNGECGALQTDCNDRCQDDINGATSCSTEAKAYIHCYADNLEGCAALPPVCEQAYCAYRRCVGYSLLPPYCR